MSGTFQQLLAALGMTQPGGQVPGPMADGAGFAVAPSMLAPGAGGTVPLPPASGGMSPAMMGAVMAGLSGRMGQSQQRSPQPQLPIASMPGRQVQTMLPGAMLPGRR